MARTHKNASIKFAGDPRKALRREIAFWLVAAVIAVWLTSWLWAAGILIVAFILRHATLIEAFEVRRVMDTARAAADQHLVALRKRRLQLIRHDAYGTIQRTAWMKEIEYFIDHYVAPGLSEQQRKSLQSNRNLVAAVINDRIESTAKDMPAYEVISSSMTPTEFETFCMEQLTRAGWSAHLTKTTGDQGVDIVGEKNGRRIAVQCKLYRQPVGNKAVQEAFAGMAFEHAQWAAVVSNSSYTPAAQQLAAANGVLLLHYSELTNLEDLLPHKRAIGQRAESWPSA